MTLTVDREADALRFRLDESVVTESEELQPGLVLDYDAAGQVVGFEILGLRNRVPADALRTLHFHLG